jgi:hypothetical protein
MYYFLNKCFDQWQGSKIATMSSRWSIYIYVWLLTYFHIFSLRLETLEYILQENLIISHCEYIKMAKYERLEITGRKYIVLPLLRKISPNFRTFPQTEETLYITIAEVICKLQVSQNVLSTKFRCRIASQILLKFNCQDYKLFLYWLFDYSFK